MRVLGIDPSLRSLGWAYGSTQHLAVVTGHLKPLEGLSGPARLYYLLTNVRPIIDMSKPVLVAYEGYAMGRFAGGGRLADLGELGGVLKMEFWQRKINVLLVPPSNLKQFMTGKGNADKDMMRAAAGNHAGSEFKSDDEADAYALLQMGMAYVEKRRLPRDRRHYRHAALRGCELIRAV